METENSNCESSNMRVGLARSGQCLSKASSRSADFLATTSLRYENRCVTVTRAHRSPSFSPITSRMSRISRTSRNSRQEYLSAIPKAVEFGLLVVLAGNDTLNKSKYEWSITVRMKLLGDSVPFAFEAQGQTTGGVMADSGKRSRSKRSDSVSCSLPCRQFKNLGTRADQNDLQTASLMLTALSRIRPMLLCS